ncbi:hypothetical protein FQZ97_772370 [compost metagenome]
MAGGQAEPPMTVRLSLLNFRPLACMWPSIICHTVGTPAAKVTPSASISSYTDLPSSDGPGNTSLQPTSAAEYGMPHALTWNIGTTGSTESCAEMRMTSGSAAA